MKRDLVTDKRNPYTLKNASAADVCGTRMCYLNKVCFRSRGVHVIFAKKSRINKIHTSFD